MKFSTLHTVFVTAFAVSLTGCDLPKPQKKSSVAMTPTESASSGSSTNYQAGAGAVQNVRAAVKRIEVKSELQQIRIFIENASLDSGKMPTVNETYQALKKEAAKIAQLIDDKVITLHPATTREQVWAYETAAYTHGGQVLTASGVDFMDAATLKQKLQ